MIRKDIKEKFPSIKFHELEAFISDYKNRYHSRIICKRQEPNTLLSHKGVQFLLSCLQRSRCIFTGFMDCVNRTHVVLAYLAARAHFETTGSTAYFLRHLRQYYNGEIEYEKMENVLFNLSLGFRTFPDKDTLLDRPVAINVLTQIDGADRLFKEMGGKAEKPFRKSYDMLSEFCHPNFFGLTIATDFVEKGTFVFYENPEFKQEYFGTLVNNMLMSCRLFFYAYDKSFSLLKNNEQMPDLIK